MPTVETTMARRLETPGAAGWPRTAHPDDPQALSQLGIAALEGGAAELAPFRGCHGGTEGAYFFQDRVAGLALARQLVQLTHFWSPVTRPATFNSAAVSLMLSYSVAAT